MFSEKSTNSEIAEIIVNATGIRGSNANYVKNLTQALRNLDISESKDQQIFKIDCIVTRMIKGILRNMFLYFHKYFT